MTTLKHGFKRKRFSGMFVDPLVERAYMKWAYFRTRSLQAWAALSTVLIIRVAFIAQFGRPWYIAGLTALELVAVVLFFLLLLLTANQRSVGEGGFYRICTISPIADEGGKL